MGAGAVGAIDADDTIEPGEALTSFAFALGGAIVLLILYRKFVQKRPDHRAVLVFRARRLGG